MAIESRYLEERGPVLGTSCLPWNQRGEQGSRSPLAINVDFSRGTIRPRPGSAKFVLGTSRFLGLGQYRKQDGESLVVGIALSDLDDANTAHPWKLTFKAWDMTGTELASVRLDTSPFMETPDPDNWYTMAQYNANLFILSKMGRPLVYNFDNDSSQPKYASGRGEYKDLNNALTFPQGSIAIVHQQSLVVAGFDGNTAHHLANELILNQSEVSEELFNDSIRKSIVPRVTEVWFGDEPYSDVFIDDRLIDHPGGGSVKGLASTPAGVLVLCENEVHLTTPVISEQEGGAGPTVTKKLLVEGVGCVHQRTVVQGKGLTAWMAPDGMYMFDGNAVQKISDDIEDLWSANRWMESPIYAAGSIASDLGYPFVVQRPRLDRACGTFDTQRNTFIWAVPLSGYEDYNRLVLEYYVVTGGWSLHAPINTSTATGVTSFRPTNFATVFDRGRNRVLFTDYNTGVYAYNESPTDYNYDLSGSTPEQDIVWYYQGAFHDLGPGHAGSVKALQIRQEASAAVDATNYYIEAERNFDADDNDLGSSGITHTSPQKGPPNNSTAVTHHWDNGRWGTTKWHRAGAWRARYPVEPINGNAFRVGFSSDATGQSGLEAADIQSYAIELQRKRDVT